ncbi:MAG: hypothetical protein IE909_04205 [Campylobacterales bacterium]|nr:hypothetical protein [Campylobacterales bacterium]
MDANQIKAIIESTKELTLLYVEDDQSIFQSTIGLLGSFFKKIYTARDGQEGV